MSQESQATSARRVPAASAEAMAGEVPRILVPLDGSHGATAALAVAQALAGPLSATVHLVHVAPRALPLGMLLRKMQLTPEQLNGGVLNQRTGAPAAEIVQAAREGPSTLIVMCTHTSEGKPSGTLGHVAREILESASVPVVLVQPERRRRPGAIHRLLLPHDGAPIGADVIQMTTDLARRVDAELVVLHIATSAAERRPAEPGSFGIPRYLDQPQHEWPSWTREFLDRLCGACRRPEGVRMRVVVITGSPGKAIVQFATDHESDLIVLAWHGRSLPRRAETLQSVIRGAPCPVVVFRIES